MSRSINQLLTMMSKNTMSEAPPPEDKLLNPDIPEMDEKEEIKDQFYNNFRMPSAPRNGTYSLPRGGSNLYYNPRKEDFLLDRSIDPNIIRAKIDPDSALPSLSSSVEYSLMPDSVRKPHSQVDLVKLSHQSEYNYRNRYVPKQQLP